MAKKMTKRMKPILETVHETAEGLHDAGLMDTKTMREFDALCLPPIKEYNAAQIKRPLHSGAWYYGRAFAPCR